MRASVSLLIVATAVALVVTPAVADAGMSWSDSPPVHMPTATPTPTALPDGGPGGGRACPGDCSGNDVVTVDELVTGVAIVLGLRTVNDCRRLDDNRDNRVVVNELVAAVSRLLFGCNFTPPTPTNTPTGEQSVCGGPITTVPQICGLTIMPTRVRRGGTITLSFGLVDREGDIDRVCAGIGPVGEVPEMACMDLNPPFTTINIFGSDSTQVGLPIGRYTFGLQVFDRAGNSSQILTADFEVIFLRV